MWTHLLKITFVALQAFWMLAILPGHVRGMIVVGGDARACDAATKAAPNAAGCCVAESGDSPKPSPANTPSPERQSRCAVCYQAHGYPLPPVFDINLAPSGLCELRRLIEPSKRHQLLCSPTYFANGPPRIG